MLVQHVQPGDPSQFCERLQQNQLVSMWDLSRRKKSAAETIHHVPPAVWMSPPAQVRVGRHPARAPLPRLRRRPRRFTLATAAIAETGASTAGTAARIAGTVVNMHDSTATVEEVQDGRCEMPGFLMMGKDPLRAGAGTLDTGVSKVG